MGFAPVIPLCLLLVVLLYSCGLVPAHAAEERTPALLFHDSSPLTVYYERQWRLPDSPVWSSTETVLQAQVCRPRAIRAEGDTCENPKPPRLDYGCAWPRNTRVFYRIRARAPVIGAVAADPPLLLDNQPWVEGPQILIVTLPPGPWTATGSVGGAARIFPVDTSGIPVIIPVTP